MQMEPTSLPIPVEGFQVENLDGEIVLLHPARNLIIYSNQTGALIWQLCNGQRSVTDIIQLLSAAYPEAQAQIAVDVPETLQTLLTRGALVME
jgi:coenzyme PQQ biosynthesis protein PqqD